MNQDILDYQFGIDIFDGDENMYKKMLNQFENTTLTLHLNISIESYNTKNYLKLKESVHTLKGASGYIGANQFQSICNNLQMICKDLDKIQNNDELSKRVESIQDLFITYLQEAYKLKIELTQVNKSNFNHDELRQQIRKISIDEIQFFDQKIQNSIKKFEAQPGFLRYQNDNKCKIRQNLLQQLANRYEINFYI